MAAAGYQSSSRRPPSSVAGSSARRTTGRSEKYGRIITPISAWAGRPKLYTRMTSAVAAVSWGPKAPRSNSSETTEGAHAIRKAVPSRTTAAAWPRSFSTRSRAAVRSPAASARATSGKVTVQIRMPAVMASWETLAA